MTKRVIVTDSNFPNLAQEQAAAQEHGAEFESHQCKTDEEVAKIVKDADIVVIQTAQFGPMSAESVKPGATVIRYGVGYDTIDLVAAKKHNLKVAYIPDYCADEVAEHTAALILTMLRQIVILDNSVRDGKWSVIKHASSIKSFQNITIGILGMGNIGRTVKRKLDGFGFQFLCSDPYLSSDQDLDVELTDTDKMIKQADVLTLHVPATKDTIGIINAKRLSEMKSSAIIVNTSRGSLIVEEDLATALSNNEIAGAALDVFEEEPLPNNSPLRRAPNCVITPHAAWYSDTSIGNLQKLVSLDITRALKNLEPRRPVPLP